MSKNTATAIAATTTTTTTKRCEGEAGVYFKLAMTPHMTPRKLESFGKTQEGKCLLSSVVGLPLPHLVEQRERPDAVFFGFGWERLKLYA
jgi:hypothetical protein